MNILPVFDLYDTSGIPFEIIALELKDNGYKVHNTYINGGMGADVSWNKIT